MIKFTAEKDDGILVGFGLSEKNIEYLKDDRPISVDLAKLGAINKPIEVIIFYGKTEQEMQEKLSPFIRSSTKTNPE
jgi:hypothetical protein